MPVRGAMSLGLRRFGSLAAPLLLLLPASAWASGVVVLRSSDLPVCVQSERAFRAVFRRRPVQVLSLAGLSMDAAAESLKWAKPEVVVAIGLKAALLARDAVPHTPLVYALVPAPERHGLVGARITGVSAEVPPALELNVLRSLAPDVRSVGVVVGPLASDWTRDAYQAAARLGLELNVATVDGLDQLGPRVRDLASHSDAIWLAPDPDVATPEVFRLELAQSLAHRVPLLSFAPPLVSAGALVAAAPDLDWLGAHLAEMTRRIIAGERPGSIPAGPIRRVRPMVNLATARAIGREVPGAALGNAEVIR